MSAAVINPVMFSGDRLLVWLGFLLASTIILAEIGDRFELPPMYDEIISAEIYHSAGGWRETKPIENDWRAAPKKNEEGRIKYDYDSENETDLSKRKTTKNNLFRLEF